MECDADKLSRQGFRIASEIEACARVVASSGSVIKHLRTTTTEALLRDLGATKILHRSFDVVVVVGHSNNAGIKLTGDHGVSWDAFAQWIAPFEPRIVLLAACEAGRLLPAKALFGAIGTLQEVIGSPVVTTEKEAAGLKLLVSYLVLGGTLPPDSGLLQGLNFALTKGVLFRQTRRDLEESDFAMQIAWTVGEEILKDVLPSIRRNLFGPQ